jgi:hypothetical protein
MDSNLDRLVDPLQRTSELLFGRKHRLHVCREILRAEPPIVHGRALAASLGIPDARVGKELHTLSELGFLLALPQPIGQQIREFQVVDGPFWDLVRALVAGADRAL